MNALTRLFATTLARVAARRLLLTTLPMIVLASGCLHHYRVTPTASGLLACETRPGETSCWESSRFDERGVLRHLVVERTTGADGCDSVQVEQSSYDADGTLVERVLEDKHCRTVDRRLTTRYDLDHDVIEHRVQRDENHDDEFDYDQSTRVAMAPHVRAMALGSGRRHVAELAERIAAAPARATVRFASRVR